MHKILFLITHAAVLDKYTQATMPVNIKQTGALNRQVRFAPRPRYIGK